MNSVSDTGFSGRIKNAYRTLSDLPKREFVRFNGDPMRYWLFMRSFQSNVMNVIDDSDVGLTYFIQYCEGEAREAIESCAILNPDDGFYEAMEILKKRFGRPYVIVRSHINNLTGGPVVRANDVNGLCRLSGQMKTCLDTLRQLSYEADLNASVTISAVLHRLPYSLQLEWCKKASGVLSEVKEPAFKDLYEFVCCCADLASTQEMYLGESSAKSSRAARADQPESREVRATVLLTNGSNASNQPHPPPCVECRGGHYLDQCPKFRSMNIINRLSCVK